MNLVKAALTNTTVKVKFRGVLSNSFKLKTGVRQGDGLSPILFNCLLEKLIREWTKTLKDDSGLRIGYKKDKLTVHCLAFADDLTLLVSSVEEATHQLSSLNYIAAKVGLKIAINKTQFISNIRDAPKSIPLGDKAVRRTNSFKYLGEWITPNLNEDLAMNNRCTKLERAYHLSKNLYKSKSLSMNLKIRHYSTVVRPSVLYASECLNMVRKGQLRKLELKDQKILRKIMGPINEEGKYRIRHNNELYEQVESITTAMRKRRLIFYGHVVRIDNQRLTSRIFNTVSRGKATNAKWTKLVRKDLEQLDIDPSTIYDRNKYRALIRTSDSLQSLTAKAVRPGLGVKWTQERKDIHSTRMKEYWAKKKAARDKNPVVHSRPKRS